MTHISAHYSRFKQLHETGCFVMPNPWDLGSARILEQLGFPALATTSSGLAWSLGRRDNAVPLADVLAHFRTIAAGVGVPVNGDYEGGFAIEPEGVAANVAAAARTGIAGLSIEDATGTEATPLFDFGLAVERIRAARGAIDAAGGDVVLTARSEGFIVGRPDLKETVRRLAAYVDAGADCVYAPGVKSLSDISTIVRAVAPRAVNVLAGGDAATVEKLALAGVRRISVGSALARAAWTAFLAVSREIAATGTFASLAAAIPFAQMNRDFFPNGKDED
jgi:2-methylisocitrate lyase-like PEP mutase family enzyme